MDKNLLNNNLDDFLRKSYENHTIEPDRALWEKINMRLYQKKTDNNLRKVRHLKIAIASLAVVLVATFIYFEIKTQNFQPKAPLTSGSLETPALLDSVNNNLLSQKQNNKSQEIISDNIKKTSDLSDNKTTSGSNTRKTKKIILPVNTIKENNKLPVISTIPFIFKPGINESVNFQINGSTGITQVSQKQDKVELTSPGLNQNLTQKGELGTTRSEVKRFPLFIEGFVSPEISYRALVVNNEYSIPDYGKTYFNNSEKADFTFSTGVLVGVGITKNMILRTGIFYSKYSHKFKTDAIHLLDAGVDENLIYTSSGPVRVILLSSDTLSNESLLKSSLNFSYLNIPFIAELHFARGYFINLGLNFNMLAGQNMNWQAENYEGNFIEATAKPIEGLKSGSFSLILGFGTEKSVSRNLSLIVNPSFKIFLSSINKTAPVKSYPYAWGLQTGLRYYFNWSSFKS